MTTVASSRPGPPTVMVGIDDSPQAQVALAWATEQAHLQGSALTVVHATAPVRVPVPADTAWRTRVQDERRCAGRALLREALATVHLLRPDVVVDEMLREGDASSILLEASVDAGVLVVGSRGRGPIASFLLGSTSDDLARYDPCPIVIARPLAAHSQPRILAATDGTDRSVAALEFAFRTAAARRVPLDVLHCFWAEPDDVWPTEHVFEERREEIDLQLRRLRDAHPAVVVHVELARGPVERLLKLATADHELVVVGRHQLSWVEHVVVGSTSAHLVEHSLGSVAVVPV